MLFKWWRRNHSVVLHFLFVIHQKILFAFLFSPTAPPRLICLMYVLFAITYEGSEPHKQAGQMELLYQNQYNTIELKSGFYVIKYYNIVHI